MWKQQYPSLHLCYWRVIPLSETYVLAMAEKGTLHACDDFVSLNAVSEVENANVHAWSYCEFEPNEEGDSCRLFDAKLTDGDTNVRVVGFQPSQKKRLGSF